MFGLFSNFTTTNNNNNNKCVHGRVAVLTLAKIRIFYWQIVECFPTSVCIMYALVYKIEFEMKCKE